MARLPGSGSVRPKLIDGIDGIGNDDVLGIIGASGGDSLCVYPPGAATVSGVTGIGNWGIGIEIFGFIDRDTRFIGGSITKVPASYDRFLPSSTGGSWPTGVVSGVGLVNVRTGDCMYPMKPGECACETGGDGRAGLTGPEVLGDTSNVV